MEGGLGAVVEQYEGHAARGVSALHYIPRLGSTTDGERDALDAAMGVFRRLVVEPLEEALARTRQPAQILPAPAVQAEQ